MYLAPPSPLPPYARAPAISAPTPMYLAPLSPLPPYARAALPTPMFYAPPVLPTPNRGRRGSAAPRAEPRSGGASAPPQPRPPRVHQRTPSRALRGEARASVASAPITAVAHHAPTSHTEPRFARRGTRERSERAHLAAQTAPRLARRGP